MSMPIEQVMRVFASVLIWMVLGYVFGGGLPGAGVALGLAIGVLLTYIVVWAFTGTNPVADTSDSNSQPDENAD